MFLSLYMRIGCINFIFFCFNVSQGLEHVREFVYVDDSWFYINFVHLLVCVGDYSHDPRNE